MVSVCLIKNRDQSFLLIGMLSKNYVAEVCAKNFGDLAKERYFLRYYNNSINKPLYTNEGNPFSFS